MQVTVLKSGRYLGPDLKAIQASEGDTITVLNEEAYVRDLERMGLASRTPPTPPAEPETRENDTPAGDSDAPTEAEAVAALVQVKGIGEALAARLVAGGITSVNALVTADVALLAEALGLSTKQIERLQAAGRQLAETEE